MFTGVSTVTGAAKLLRIIEFLLTKIEISRTTHRTIRQSVGKIQNRFAGGKSVIAELQTQIGEPQSRIADLQNEIAEPQFQIAEPQNGIFPTI